ncbi:hypothetical protein RhiirA5_497517 [Rhizophagus irregularis]|uniref:Uncharacterized protein n=3 Tax=Rhizophagus irregularis TaxID=588596 RepID=A0A2N0PXU3_9GLOM|nr:hypothetical protein RhiirA5_497517 [Rhizophagus irregularis]UZO29154.1 hypothetical protein OCT59_022643 [Rhizophagus irregularis]CAB5123515.1 unnamed protein product [Rhizophagus irregularis]
MKCNKNFVVEKEYCVWTYALCDCGEQENIFRNIIMGGALLNGLCVVLSVLSLMLLKRKINYIRVWSLIFCTTRLICCSVILFDLFNDETLLRELIFIISWWPGIVAIFVYLSIVIRVIPRLNLNQNTNNKYKTILIPAGGKKRIITLLWPLLLFTLFSMTTISSILSHYFNDQLNERNINREKLLNNLIIMKKCVLISVLIPCSISLLLIIYYGRLLVTLAKSSLRLVGINDANINFKNDHLLHKKTFKIDLFRMQLYNWIFGLTYFCSSIALLLIIISNNVLSNMTLNIIYCIALNIIIPISIIIILSVTINVDILKSKSGWDEQQINTTYIYSSEYGSSQRYHNNNNSQQTLSSFQSITRASSQLEPNWTNNNQEIQSNRQSIQNSHPSPSLPLQNEDSIQISILQYNIESNFGLLNEL